MTREEQLELADKILKGYETWARDSMLVTKHCVSAESLGGEQDEEVQKIIELVLCEEALECCRHAIASLSNHQQMNIKAQYTGLQGYYRRKLNPKQLARSRRVIFDNVIWQDEVEISMLSFLNLLKQKSGRAFNRYFVIN